MGQLGDGSTISRSNPVQVVDAGGSSLTNTISASGGMWHSMILKSDGTMGILRSQQLRPTWRWDDHGSGQPRASVLHDAKLHWLLLPRFRSRPLPRESEHTVYLKADGTVRAAGYNGSGRLGDGTTANRSNPVQVVDGSGKSPERGGGDRCGRISHTVYLKARRNGVGSGASTASGQLGDGTTTRRTNPEQVASGSGNPLSGVVGILRGAKLSHGVFDGRR